MDVRSLKLPALGVIAVAVALAACQKKDDSSTSQSMSDKASQMTADASRKMDEAKQDMKDAARSAADTTTNKVSDATITAEVNTALAKDPTLSALRINVDTAEGRVILRGKAPDAASRERATQLAQNVKGVISVDNQLMVAKG
jgi:osmotically-inducible protein OsmY